MKTVVLGASPNPSRYAYMAAQMLTDEGHEIVPMGIKRGSVMGQPILPISEQPDVEDVDTVTVYVGASNLADNHDYILSLNPRRIIFNPGAENPELARQARDQGIEVVHACTLVMISTRQY